jgi:cytochrome c
MDSYEWNKIAGAVLGALIFVLAVRFATEAIFEVEKPAKEAYHVEGVAVASTGGSAAAPAEETLPDFGTVVPAADVTAGKTVAIKCEQCHDISKGGPNKIGPELWNVIGRPRASESGFSYSSAMNGDHSPWTYASLYKYLKSPQSMVPGTKMSFAGLHSEGDRINLLAYLRTQEDSPAPIPAPTKAADAATPATK